MTQIIKMEKQIKNRFEKIEKRVDNLEKFLEDGLSKKGHLVTCHRCNNSWICKSKKRYVSCTDCGTKVRNTGYGELVTCFKCKKKLDKKDAIFQYNSHFHKKCYLEFDKKSGKEVNKMNLK